MERPRRIFEPDPRTVEFVGRAREEGVHDSWNFRERFRDPDKVIELTETYLDPSEDVDLGVLARKNGVRRQAVQQTISRAIVLFHANASPQLQAEYPLETLKAGRVEKKKEPKHRNENIGEFYEKLYRRALAASTDDEARDIIPQVPRGQVQKHRDAYVSFLPIAKEVGLNWRADRLAELLDFVGIPSGKVQGRTEDNGKPVYYRFILPLHVEISRAVFALQVGKAI